MFRHAVLLAAYLLLGQCSSTSIWHISIDEAPAPPPDEGPPLSVHALRDKSKLPYEIVGICAAYALCLVVAGVGILFGRRVRKKVSSSYSAPRRRMFSPKLPSQVVEHPMDNKSSLKSPRSGRFTSWINPASRHKHQLSVQSVSTVDEKILDRDRARNEDEMAKLYAAVLVHDREKSLRSRETVNEIVEQRPAELQYLRNGGAAPNQSSYSIATTAAEDGLRSQGDTRPNSRKTKVTPLSIVPQAYDRAESTRSQLSQQGRLSARGQVISSPVNFSHPISPRSPSSMNEETPLSPRLYNPGPPPPVPGSASINTERYEDAPETRSIASAMSPPPTPGTKSAAAHARELEWERVQRARAPASLTFQGQESANNLPFRQAYPDLQSAPPIQTTFLDRSPHLYGGPRTGVPPTPYSAYQPQTPLTPITPRRLATRQELKKNKKKYGAGPLSPDDIVSSEAEMWGEPE